MFASAGLVNPKIFKRQDVDDCLVNGGSPLAAGSTISFKYANTFQYPLSLASATCGQINTYRRVKKKMGQSLCNICTIYTSISFFFLVILILFNSTLISYIYYHNSTVQTLPYTYLMTKIIKLVATCYLWEAYFILISKFESTFNKSMTCQKLIKPFF